MSGTNNAVEPVGKRSLSRQIILGLLTNFCSIAPSMSLGFSAVALPTLTNNDNPYMLTMSQASWFASIASLATPFGSFFSGPISDRYGRRMSLFSINTVCFLGWLVLALAYYSNENQFYFLLIGRLLTGLSTGLSSAPATVYMAEVSTDKLRGVFTTWSSISFSAGVLFVYVLGYILKEYWGTICLITAALPCIGMFFSVFLIPESPSWLVGKGRYDEARQNMCHLYNEKLPTNSVNDEIEKLIQSKGVKTGPSSKKSFLQQVMKKIKFLTKPIYLKPFAIILTYFFFQQFSGIFVIVFYAINIVKDAGVTMDPYFTIVLIGSTRMFSAVLLSFISRKIGRRPLSIFSGIGMTLCMLILGIYIIYRDPNSSSSVFPVFLLLIYFFASTLGFLTLPFAMSAEMFPTKIRGTASGLSSCIAYIFSFITIKIYPDMSAGMGRQGVFFFYGAMSLIGTIFVIICLPETKGKSFQEIQEYFAGGRTKGKDMEMETLKS